MIRCPIRWFCLGCLGFAGIFTSCATQPSGERAAAAALENYIHLLRRQDAVGLAGLFVPDGSTSHAGQKPIVGRPAIRAMLESFANYKVLAHNMEVTTVMVDGPRVRQSGAYHQTVRTPDGQTIQVQGKFTAEWERQDDGRWLLRRMHTAPPDQGK